MAVADTVSSRRQLIHFSVFRGLVCPLFLSAEGQTAPDRSKSCEKMAKKAITHPSKPVVIAA
jgi:hypothetical protein